MAGLGDYEGPGKFYLNNNLLAEAMSVRVALSGNNNKVFTMRKGLAGRSRGAIESELTVENAVPLAGLEGEFMELCISNSNVTAVIDFAGKRYSYDGWIEGVELGQSTDGAATCSFTIPAGKPRIL